MNERNWGQVVPFALSAAKMRRGAHIRRKQGAHLEATELLRQAAWAEDSVLGWLALGQQLRALGCYEQASAILARLLAREERVPDIWLELGRCLRAMGQTEIALDCYYHFLQEDPYSAAADEARMALSDLEAPDHAHEPLRLMKLIHRGMSDWQDGRRERALRRLHRALRMTRQPERLSITIALMYMAEGNPHAALPYTALLLRREPQNPRCLTTMATIFSQMDKPRIARAFLRRSMPHCQDVAGEELFLSAAAAIFAHKEAGEYLRERLKKQPHRIALLHALADQCYADGQKEKAQQIWQRILRLDPDDRRARVLRKWTPEHPEMPLPPPFSLPAQALRSQLAHLTEAVASHTPAEEMLRSGTQTRAVLDWCFSLRDAQRQSIALGLLMRSDHPAVIRYFKELLLSSAVAPEIQQCVLVRLAELGEMGPMLMLVGGRFTPVQCQKASNRPQSLWRLFLPSLLHESRFWQQSEHITALAADIWPLLSPEQRQEAATHGSICWAKAIELLYLHMTGQEEAAFSVMARLSVSPRRVRRILRAIQAKMECKPVEAGDE